MRSGKDLTGRRFGKLIAIQPLDVRQSGCIVWECRCDCGKTITVRSNNLTCGRTRSCGCGGKRELRGMRFGSLVVEEATTARLGGHVVWRCRCDCGKETFVSAQNLVSGNTSSCGCRRNSLSRERAKAWNRKEIVNESCI